MLAVRLVVLLDDGLDRCFDGYLRSGEPVLDRIRIGEVAEEKGGPLQSWVSEGKEVRRVVPVLVDHLLDELLDQLDVVLGDEPVGEHSPALVDPQLLEEVLLVLLLADCPGLDHEHALCELAQLSDVELVVGLRRGREEGDADSLEESDRHSRHEVGVPRPASVEALPACAEHRAEHLAHGRS